MKQKKDRIIHFTGMNCTKFGGIERYFLSIARQLINTNTELVLVYETEIGVSDYREELISVGVNIETLAIRNRNILLSSYKILQIIVKYNPRIIHAHFEPASSLIVFIAKLVGVKFIYLSLHSTVLPLNSLSLKSRIISFLRTKCATNILCVSDAIRLQQTLNFKWSADKCKTEYIGISQTSFVKRTKLGDKYKLINVAFHHKDKGIDVLIKAIHILVYEFQIKNIELLQIGSESTETDNLKKLISELSLDKYVKFMGIRNDVPDLLRQGHIYIQPSRFEGIGLALIEAMSQGCIGIGSNVGGIPEVINHRENGFMFESEDHVELAQLLQEVIQSDDMDKMSLKSHQSIYSKFSLERNIQKYVQEYNLLN